jgi:hypothetical protein
MVALGRYYKTKEYGLIRTVCHATNLETQENMIGFVKIGKGGLASDMALLNEKHFRELVDEIAF